MATATVTTTAEKRTEEDEERQAKRRRRQKKKMTKILSMLWGLDNSEHFQEVSDEHFTGLTTEAYKSGPLDLTTMGRDLERGVYTKTIDLVEWKHFARDLVAVYDRFIKGGKNVKTARRHLEQAGSFLQAIDPRLSDIANEHDNEHDSNAAITPAKRKIKIENDGILQVPKKKIKSTGMNNGSSDNLTLSQMEENGMKSLETFIEECGGQQEQSNSFRCKVTPLSGDRFSTVYISSQGRPFCSMDDVVHFLNLSRKKNPTPTKPISKNLKRGVPGNNRVLHAEQKKLRRELDKLLKIHTKTSKALDDFRNEKRDDQTPMDDCWLMEHKDGSDSNNGNDISTVERTHKFTTALISDVDSSLPGFPEECIPDVLMAWDFLCTFSRPLSLQPIGFDQFLAALTYKPPLPLSKSKQHSQVDNEVGVFVDEDSSIIPPTAPLYIAEAHLALLKLLLSDPSSDDWWWSTLETPETEAQESGKSTQRDGIIGAGVYGGSCLALSGRNGLGDDTDRHKPTIKVDIASLLSFLSEDLSTTRQWLQALEDVRSRRSNNGNAVKSAIKSAISITTNPFVKTYLRKAMKKWKVKAARPTITAVEWLVLKVREARPDLWGREMNPEVIIEQKAKVIKETSLGMEGLEDEPDVDNSDVGESEEEVDESEDEDDEEDDDENNNGVDISGCNNNNLGKKTNNKKKEAVVECNNDSAVVKTAIPINFPPSLVDLLLPPGKPIGKSDLVSALTWPCLAGASACRIVHRYRRLRNEVDDGLREFRELGSMTVSERRRREEQAPFRIFSECFSTMESEGDDENGTSPVESAIHHLCEGKDYLDLTPVKRLCILRTLIEAAYDTHRIHQCVQDNIQSRIGAEKLLENEKRRARKEAKVEATELESAARTRLVREIREEFLTKKRREIARKRGRKYEQQHADDDDEEEVDIESILLDFDEETRAEYDSLPTLQDFNKSDVNAMVKKINEETAFDTVALEVLTLDEIQAREAKELTSMEEELSTYGDIENVYKVGSRETSAKVEQLKREISSYREWLVTLPPLRKEAIETLKDAIEDGTIKALRSAIKNAKLALFTGDNDDNSGKWALDLLRDAALEVKVAEKRKRITEAQRDLIAKRNKCFVRTERVGVDRAYNSYWEFDHDESNRIWCEVDYRINLSHELQSKEDSLTICVDTAIIGAKDIENDLLQRGESAVLRQNESLLSFSRQEYHPSGFSPTLVKRRFGCFSSTNSLRPLVKILDGRGVREGPLKTTIKEILEGRLAVIAEEVSVGKKDSIDSNNQNEEITPSPKVNVNDSTMFEKYGDEAAFRKAKTDATNLDQSSDNSIGEILSSIHSAIDQRFRLCTMVDSIPPDTAEYCMGTITGWTPNGEQGVGIDENTDEASTSEKPIWRLTLDMGGEKELFAFELIAGLVMAEKWKHQQNGYIESDSTLLSYRNKLGRFCGKAADAPNASSPAALSRLVIKREHELYVSLKNRTSCQNTWGGKNGERISWIASMKDYSSNFDVICDGLLTLENAFFELCGGFTGMDESVRTAEKVEDLLKNEHRYEVELESIENKEGLWNSEESRMIFRKMISSCTTCCFLALCLDLLYRNCQAFLQRNKPTITRNSIDSAYYATNAIRVTRSSFENPSQQPTTRRMNAWQQQHTPYY